MDSNKGTVLINISYFLARKDIFKTQKLSFLKRI